MKKKYKAEDLEDFIDEETECEIQCSLCGDTANEFGESYYEKNTFFKKGWRAVDDENVYCPKCAKKKLKS